MILAPLCTHRSASDVSDILRPTPSLILPPLLWSPCTCSKGPHTQCGPDAARRFPLFDPAAQRAVTGISSNHLVDPRILRDMRWLLGPLRIHVSGPWNGLLWPRRNVRPSPQQLEALGHCSKTEEDFKRALDEVPDGTVPSNPIAFPLPLHPRRCQVLLCPASHNMSVAQLLRATCMQHVGASRTSCIDITCTIVSHR
jgi:hypothetical protein